MRRVLGLVLTGLGAFLLALAVLLRFYLPGQVVKFPLNEYRVITLTGHDVTYFNAKQLKVLTGVTAKATSTIEGDVSAGSSPVAVWNDFTAVEDTTNNAPIEFISQRSAFSRRTGAIDDCCGAYVSISNVGTRNGHQSGQGFVWPLGTQKQTYQVFDATLGKPEPFRYDGTSTIDGMTVYKFVEHVINQQFASQTLPGSLVGYGLLPSVTLPEYVSETNTFWVDPATGAPVDVTENRTFNLEDITGATKLVLYHGDLMATPQSIASAVNTAKSAHLRVDLVEDIGPLAGLLLGVGLVVIGVALILDRRGSEEFTYESDETVGSTR
jgi:Porin PorA